MHRNLFTVIQDAVTGFFADDCLTRAAGIAYFALFSIGPLLFIATGTAGLVFGREVVSAAVQAELRAMVGPEAAVAVADMTSRALGETQGGLALAIGLGVLVVTASGVFAALQGALNAVWKVPTVETETMVETVGGLVRARAAAMGLVAAAGFLMLVSLLASTALSALGGWLDDRFPGLPVLLRAAQVTLSLLVLSAMFAAIYKVLPDRSLAWRDVMVGAVVTAVLFTLGKLAIAFYVGYADVGGRFGGAGTVAVVLIWLYYSAVIFLLGAEFTRAWSAKAAARPEDGYRDAMAAPGAVAMDRNGAAPRELGPALLALGVLLLLSRVFRRPAR
jgi:membrane protein